MQVPKILKEMGCIYCCHGIWAPTALSYFTAISCLIISIIATSGNALIILAVYKDPFHRLRTSFSYFTVNLAVSDLVMGVITMPISVIVDIREALGQESDLNKANHISFFVSSTASTLSLAALCLDRYIAISRPIRYRKSLRMSRCAIISAIIWLCSLSLPMAYFKTGYILYMMVHMHASVLATLLILSFTYRQTYKTLRNQAATLKDLQQTSANKATHEDARKMQTEKKVTRAFLLILILFILSYTPAVIMQYILEFCPQCDCTLRHVLRDLLFILVSANSCMNPFICTIRLRPFREAVIAVVGCKRKETRSAEDSSVHQLDAISEIRRPHMLRQGLFKKDK